MNNNMMKNGIKYLRHENTIQLVHTNVSTMEMVSSMFFHIQEYILSQFPSNMFKSVRVDTANISSMKNNNVVNGTEAEVIEYPSITISPEITLDEPYSGTEINPHMAYANKYMFKDKEGYYRKIIKSPDNIFSIYDTESTLNVLFHFKIATKTFEQNGNMIHYIRNMMLPNKTLKLHNKQIQTELPKKFVKTIAKLQQQLYDTNLTMNDIEYLISSLTTTRGNIYKKLNTMTGKYCMFMGDPVTIDFTLQNLNGPGTIIRDNHVEGEYIIDFTIQACTKVSGSFIMDINFNKFKIVADDSVLIDELFKDEYDDGVVNMSLYSPIKIGNQDSITFKDSLGEEHYGQLLISEVLTFGIDDKDNSVVNLEQFFKDDILKLHSYMVSKNLDIQSLLNISVQFRNQHDASFVEVDYDLLTIKFGRITDDIMIGVYVDRSIYDFIYKQKLNDKFIYSNNFLTTFKFTINEGDEENPKYNTKHIIVKSFSNDKEMEDVNDENCLRVNTIYGPGYLYTVDEDHELASDLKIFIGKDKRGYRKIKSLVMFDEK